MAESVPFGQHTIHRYAGQGRTVVLLNGCALASVAWNRVVAELRGRPLVLLDRPGRCGTPAAGPPDLLRETQHLAQVIAGDGPVLLVAHSMAAFQAEALARLFPGLVAGVVLVDPSVEPEAHSGLLGRAGARVVARVAAVGLRLEPVRRLAAAVVRAGMRRETAEDGPLAEPGWRADHETTPALSAAVAELAGYGAQADDLARLRKRQAEPVGVPTVLLEGREGYSATELAVLRRAFARLGLRRLPESGHLVMLDAPEAIAQAVRDLDHLASDGVEERGHDEGRLS
ncbi:MAG: alpha/beta hydrolase [Actinomycetia bacterium]|nr:alpha/beta hydrolase [Actinomycetes bacterium]